jgi:hypothetical protein
MGPGPGLILWHDLWKNQKEGDSMEDPGEDGSIILRWIFKKWDEGTWTG